jgi:hypothetical protein
LEEFVNRESNIAMWMGVSAKTGQNVDEVHSKIIQFFHKVGTFLFNKYHEDGDFREMVEPKKDSLVLNTHTHPPKTQKNAKKSCCH